MKKYGAWKYIRQFKGSSIFIRNFFTIICAVMIPVAAAGVIIYNEYNGYIEKSITESKLNEAGSVSETVNLVIMEAERMAYRVANENTFDSFFRGKVFDTNSYSKMVEKIELSRALNSMLIYGEYIENICIYENTNNAAITSNQEIGSIENLPDTGWMERYLSMKSNSCAVYRAPDSFSYRPEYISIIQRAPMQGSANLGAVIVNINLKNIKKIINESSEKTDSLIVTKAGEVVFRSSPESGLYEKYGSVLRKNADKKAVCKTGDYVAVRAVSEYTGWEYIAFSPLDDFNKTKKGSLAVLFVSMLVVFVFAAVFSFYASLRSFAPIKSILQYIDENNRRGIQSYDTNEVKYILNALELDRKQTQEELNLRLEKLKEESLRALRYQINPHFLYNTLETVNWKIMRLCGRDNEASRMLLELSFLLRTSLDTSDNLTDISTELEYIEKYIDLMKARYKNFEVEWDIAENLRQYKTVKLSLQPIVENAIYHGIKPLGKHGLIKISLRKTQEDIVFEICDNGVGISQKKCDEINSETGAGDEHIGLRNVNERIKIMFGMKYGLFIAPRGGGGTVVTMHIPIIE